MEELSTFIVYVLLFLTLYFEVFLLITYIEESETFSRTITPERTQYPSVTIVVPAWNESKTIGNTINSLLALDYPKDLLRFYVIDDGSTDNTLEVARQFEVNPQVHVFTKENGGKHTALNFAIAHSDSELIGCLDADSFVDSQALKEIIPYFDNNVVMAVTPSVQIHKPDNVLRKLQATEYMIGAFTRKVFSRINGLYVTPGPFSIYRKSIFDKIGGFIHAYGTEDMEMALRMQANRMKIENAHTAFVYTVAPNTLRALYKQRVRWVSGFLKNAFLSYRHMFLDKRYGNLGLLVLPFAFASIFIAIFFSALYVKSLIKLGFEKYIEYSAIGFHFGFHLPKFDWFSLDLEFRTLVIYILFFTTLFFVIMGIRMAKERFVLSLDMFYFLLLYGIIAPFWLIRSLYNLVTTKEASWR